MPTTTASLQSRRYNEFRATTAARTQRHTHRTRTLGGHHHHPAFPDIWGSLGGRLVEPALVQPALRLALRGDRMAGVQRRPTRRRAGHPAWRALRHDHPHALGDRHRGSHDLRGDAHRRG